MTAQRAFNERFAGQILPGSPNPRQARTRGSLMTQSHRIPEVGRLTGLKVRGNRQSLTPAKPAHKHNMSTTPAETPQPSKIVKPNTPEEDDEGEEADKMEDDGPDKNEGDRE